MTGSAGHREKKNEYIEGKKELTEETPVTLAFRAYSEQLNHKHDKYERIVKHSRDITIGCKRIIFAVHALLRSNNPKDDINKINHNIGAIREQFFKSIAKELRNEDHYKYIRAYTWGLQEYIEALTFYQYVTENRFYTFEDVVKSLCFDEPIRPTELTETEEIPTTKDHKVHLLVPVIDYLLGLHDLTGEMMRHSINCFAAQKYDVGFQTCNFVKRLYAAMQLLTKIPADYGKKMSVTRQSLEKMEYSCYNAYIRGSESLPFSADTGPEGISASY